MANYTITSQHLTLNGTDMTAYVRSATLELDADQNEFSNMASGGAREYRLGLKSGTLNIEFNQDYAASATDSLLWAIWNTGTNVTFTLRPTSSGVSATNPNYSGTVVPTSYQPVGGGVGDLATISVSWPTTGAITRATS